MVVPKNSKDVKGLREMFTNIRSQICSAAGAFAAPLKALMDEIVAKYDAVLASLPKDDLPGDWCIDSQMETLCSLLASASAALTMSGLEVSKAKENQAEYQRSMEKQMASLVTTEIEKKITAGDFFTKAAYEAAKQPKSEEFVPKATVTQLCSESRALGMQEGEKKVRDEVTAADARRELIATRKSGLQTASLPIPDAEFESVLGGTDAEFEAAKALVGTRRESLKKQGFQLNSDQLLSKLWLPEKDYGLFEKTVTSIDALKFNADPLATPGGATSGKAPLIF